MQSTSEAVGVGLHILLYYNLNFKQIKFTLWAIILHTIIHNDKSKDGFRNVWKLIKN